MTEAQIANAGVGRKFQKPTVIGCLSVWHNLELAMAGPRSVWATFRAKLTERTERQTGFNSNPYSITRSCQYCCW